MNDPSAYGLYEAPRPSGARPAVITWFRVYAATLVLFSCGLLGLLVYMAQLSGIDAVGAIFDLVMLAFVLAFGAFYAVAAMIPFKPWGWTFGLIAICLGLSSVFVIASVPLLIFWMKPETKAAFGRL